MDNIKLRNEVDFRLAKMTIQVMANHGIITGEEMEAAIDRLLDKFHPPFACLERGIYFNEDTKD